MLKRFQFIKHALRSLLILTGVYATDASAAMCGGRFPNPVTDVCWMCVFPIYIGPAPIGAGTQPNPWTDVPPPLICTCPTATPPWIRFGIGISYWEPARVAEAVRTSYCSPFLGGAQFGPVTTQTGQTKNVPGASSSGFSFYHLHWFQTPILQWVGSAFSSMCGQAETFDLGYITELDPLWIDDELAFMINPESILFGNPVAQVACAADTASAALSGFGVDSLFWCSGSQGSVYPMTGNVVSPNGAIDASIALVHRHVARMHRFFLAMDTSTVAAMCFPTGLPQPIVRKNQYKQQMMYPVPNNLIGLGFGVPSVTWGAGRDIPYIGEDFNYIIWRKRTCCFL